MNSESLYGECRCCLAVGEHRDVMKEYVNEGRREVYFDMFLECFNVFLSTPIDTNLICKQCIERLRDANAFRIMVVNAEKDLQAACQRYQVLDENPPDIEYELVTDGKGDGSPILVENYSPILVEDDDEDFVSHTPVIESVAQHLLLPSPAPNNKEDCSMMLECDFCLKEFYSKQQLASHIAEHSVENECTEVNIGANDSATAGSEIHKRNQDKDGPPYVCRYCDKQYKVAFKKHVRNHTGSKPYVCKFCSKRFAHWDTKMRHKVMWHEGRDTALPHPCAVCNNRFSTKHELNRHGLVHTKEKPYLCDTCGKGFTKKDYLVDHFDMHAGVKAYSCAGCKKKFTYVYQYTWHKKKCKKYKKKKRV